MTLPATPNSHVSMASRDSVGGRPAGTVVDERGVPQAGGRTLVDRREVVGGGDVRAEQLRSAGRAGDLFEQVEQATPIRVDGDRAVAARLPR